MCFSSAYSGQRPAFMLRMPSAQLRYQGQKSFTEGESKSKKWMSADHITLEKLESRIRIISGGLVEFVQSERLQFMHQTVQEFVEQSRFKIIVLDSRGRVTAENGHSFIAKEYVFSAKKYALGIRYATRDYQHLALRDQAIFHLQNAERTTGLSQYSTLVGAPFLGDGVELPVAAGLTLYLKDAILSQPRCLADGPSNLTSVLLKSMRKYLFLDANEATEVAKFIVANGYRADRDIEGLTNLIYGTHRWSFLERIRRQPRGIPFEERFSIVFALLEGCQDLQDLKRVRAAGRLCEGGATAGYKTCTSQMLHYSPSPVVERLLLLGADPNVVDRTGNTPLDTLLKDSSYYPSEEIHRICVALAEKDARLRKATISMWERFIKGFQDNELDTEVFERYGYPKWLPGFPQDSLPVVFRKRVKNLVSGR